MAADREGDERRRFPATGDGGSQPGDGGSRVAGDATLPPETLPPAFEDYAADDLPNATPRGHGKDGVLEATFASASAAEAGRTSPTRLLQDRAEVPLHHTGTLEHDPIGPTLCIQEPTGGVAQGDRHRIAVEARESARCVVTTQAATKVHSMHSDYAHLDVALAVGAGAHVEYVPGPTIVNEDARCLQTARVDLAPGASVIVSDVLVSDGLSDHEPFEFDHYHARIDARHDGELVCADAVDLRPDERDARDPASVGEYTVVGTLYVLAPDATTAGETAASGGDCERGALFDGSVDDLADRVHERLTAVESDDPAPTEDRAPTDDPAPTGDQLRTGASVLPFEAGVGVRVLGTRSEAVEAALTAARDEARDVLFGVGVPDRRWAN